MAEDIAQWLVRVGLGPYVQVFAKNSIDFDLLSDISEDDLKELGLNIGERRRLLRAIRELDPSKFDPVPITLSSDLPEPRTASPPDAERRQITILFADLVGSTALTEAMDPEEYRELLGAYQSAAQRVIEQFDGFIAKYMGDGLLVYFGYPTAHEDDAERAVRAGLNLVSAVSKLDSHKNIELKVRVGIATGLVVAGDIVGEGTSQERAVLGEAPNLAARLQAIAEPNQVVIAESTWRLAGANFDYDDLGIHRLKGFSTPQPVWLVTRERRASSRFEATRRVDLTPFVGRDEELGQLSRRWALAQDGEGQVVLLSGEAGIGKSRLIEAFLQSASTDKSRVLRYQCSPHHTNSTLYPIIEQLKAAAGFEHDESPEDRLDKLEALLSLASDNTAVTVALIARLLSIPTERKYPPLEYTPEQLKQKTLDALVSRLKYLCEQEPIILLFEDLHWVDPTSMELLSLIVDEVRNQKILAVSTFRPEFVAPWVGDVHVSLITFNRLNRKACNEIITGIAGDKSLPADLIAQIVEKTDGVPLFVEELTQTVLKSDLVVEENNSYSLAGPLIPLSIPDTLQESLAARLDQLDDVRVVAQTAAAIGREFSRAVLMAVVGHSDREIDEALARLVESGLVIQRGSENLLFKHALVRDVAYESMLKSYRLALHGRIAKTVETHFPETAATQPELLAYHYIEANMVQPALEYLKRAGERDLESCAYSEAIAKLEHGLELIEQLPRDASRARREIALRILLGVPLMSREGWASDAVEDNYQRACALCEEYGENEQLFPALWGLWMNLMMRSKARMACDLADRLLSVGEDQNDVGLQLQAHHSQWTSRMTLGQLKETLEHTERGIELYDPERHHVLTYTYGGHDAGVCARQIGSLALWLAGYPERARKRLDAGFELADKLGHLNTLVEVLGVGMILATAQRDANLVTEWTEKLFELTPAGEYETYELWGEGALGWARYMRGEREEGLRAMRGAVPSWLKHGVAWTAPMIALAAPVISREAQGKTGLEMLEQTLELMHRDEAHWFEAEIHRVTGEVLESDGARCSDEAERSYQRAMEIAQKQGAKMLELRAATNLSQAWQRQGKADDARKLLTDTYNWFSEGFDTPDLKAAKLLLDQLS